MADSSLHPASNAAEQGRKMIRLPSLPRSDSSSSFVPPRVASALSRRRHLPVRDAVRALALAVVPGTEELHASLCTRAVSSKAGYWVPKSRQDDPFLQKVLTAKNLQLERLPFRDAYLYQYGLLPDQYVPPRDDHAISLHPCDKVDAKLPQSLLRMEATKQLGEGRMSSTRREVSAWDGTVKNVTAPLLWRTREPLF